MSTRTTAVQPVPPDVAVRIEQADGLIVSVPFSSLVVIRTDPIGCGCRRWSCARPGGGTVHLFTNAKGRCYHGDVFPERAPEPQPALNLVGFPARPSTPAVTR